MDFVRIEMQSNSTNAAKSPDAPTDSIKQRKSGAIR